jgi:hypothetical protein
VERGSTELPESTSKHCKTRENSVTIGRFAKYLTINENVGLIFNIYQKFRTLCCYRIECSGDYLSEFSLKTSEFCTKNQNLTCEFGHRIWLYDADHQVRRRWRRSRRQNLSPYFIHYQQVSIGICANGEQTRSFCSSCRDTKLCIKQLHVYRPKIHVFSKPTKLVFFMKNE